MYLNDLTYLFNFDRNIVNDIFIKMMSNRNLVIAETKTSDNFCFILNILEHKGFHTNDIRTHDINIIVHKTSTYKMLRTTSFYYIHINHGFMECLKLPNNECVIYVIVKQNVSDNVTNVKINCVLNVSIIIIKSILIHVHIVDIICYIIVGTELSWLK